MAPAGWRQSGPAAGEVQLAYKQQFKTHKVFGLDNHPSYMTQQIYNHINLLSKW